MYMHVISGNYTIHVDCKRIELFKKPSYMSFSWQDIVTESSSFDLVSFIPLLRDRIYTANPFAKQFLVSWVSVCSITPFLNKNIDLLAETEYSYFSANLG